VPRRRRRTPEIAPVNSPCESNSRSLRPSNDANENASDPGWGRGILAPAAGTVVYARNDVPTNPHPGEEPGDNWYRALHDPVMAYAGNCVIVDHGNSEYSVMMHMQPGSVTVKVRGRDATGK